MKKLFLSLLLLITPCILFSYESEFYDLNYLDVESSAPPPSYPFSISGGYLSVKKADFRTPEVEDETLKYSQGDLALAYTHPFNSTWGLIFGAGWVGSEVNWAENPDFDETHFNYINFSIGAFTKAYADWTWTLTFAAFLDTEHFSFMDYALYQGVLWGRYQYCSWLEFDFGLITEVGLNKEKAWPIIGFIYTPCPKLRLNVVYPINISLEYDFLSHWTVASSIRFLRNRHRVGADEPLSQGIFEYRTTGAELDLIYSPFKWFIVKGFAGSTFDGDLKITNRKDKDGTHYKFEGSFYAGVNAVLSY